MQTVTQGILIKQDGTMVSQLITEHELTVSSGLMAKLAGEMVLRTTGIVAMEGCRSVNLALDNTGKAWWTLILNELPLRAPYRLNSKSELVPAFRANDNIMDLSWLPPKDLRVVLLVPTSVYDAGKYSIGHAYLLALDPKGVCYRMPLANLYEDGRLCTGEYEVLDKQQLPLVLRCLDQLHTGRWSADLADRTKTELTESLFRFKPENSGFKQLPLPEGMEWKDCCGKIAPAALKFISL